MHSRRNLFQAASRRKRRRRTGATPAFAKTFEVTHTDAEWRKLLSPAEYNILRQQGTEAPIHESAA